MANDGQLVAALPGAVRLGGDQLGQRGQCSQSLAMPQRLDGGGEVVTQSGSALIATALGELSDLLNGRGQRGVVNPPIKAAALGTASAYCAAVTSRAAGQADTSSSGQAGPCRAERVSRVVQVRSPVQRASSAAVSAALGRIGTGRRRGRVAGPG